MKELLNLCEDEKWLAKATKLIVETRRQKNSRIVKLETQVGLWQGTTEKDTLVKDLLGNSHGTQHRIENLQQSILVGKLGLILDHLGVTVDEVLNSAKLPKNSLSGFERTIPEVT